MAQIRKGTKDRPQSTQLMLWVINAMVTNILMGVEAVQSSVNDLMARKNKCLVTCYILKRQLLMYLLDEGGKMWLFDVVSTLRDITSCNANFRKYYEPRPGHRVNDLAFMATWPNSARFFPGLLDQVSVQPLHAISPHYQAVARSNGSVHLLMQAQPFADVWDRVKHAYENETKEKVPARSQRDSSD